MRRTARKTGLLITSAAAGLATLSHCSAGLLGDLFDKHSDKDRVGIEKRMPACDCSFGYFSTAWQPWGTCDQTSEAGCSSGACRNSAPTFLRSVQPGYSTGPSMNAIPPYGDSWPPHNNVLPPASPDMFNGVPNPTGSSPAPILMTPLQPEPATEFPPSSSSSAASPRDSFEPPSANPFPRAITTNPELPTLNTNPYSPPGLNQTPGGTSGISPQPQSLPQPQLSPGVSVPLDPAQPSFSFPQAAPQQSLPQPLQNYGSSGTGVPLPPRRATSVTIDIPPGSAGTSLSLPDPVRSGSNFGGTSLPSPDNAAPSATPGNTGRPLTPEPSLRPQPPAPRPSVVPGSDTTYRMLPLQAAPQFSAIQQANNRPMPHANSQPMMRQGSTVPPQQFPTQQFQPATHWQAVPQMQPQQQTGWRVIPGAYPPAVNRQNAVQPPQHRSPTPSERVIYLPPPPRR